MNAPVNPGLASSPGLATSPGKAISSSLARIRAENVGSLMRPPYLREAYARAISGEIGAGGLRAAQDEAIRCVLAHQQVLDLPVVTDGEFRRSNFQESFACSVSGFEASGQRDPAHLPVLNRQRAVAPLELVRNVPLDEFQAAREWTDRPVKVTLIGPDRIFQRFAWEESADVYPDREAFIADVVRIQRQMVQQLVAAGCRYIQLDDPSYTAYVDETSLEQMRSRGEDPAAMMTRLIEAENDVIAGFEGVVFSSHICRGGGWPPHRFGAYDAIAEQLFASLGHTRLLLEYHDSDAAGSFELLRYVPRGKIVVLGLLDQRIPDLEGADALRRKIDDASHYLPLEQLAISPRCGFAADMGASRMSEDDQWRKLERMQEIATAVWG